MEQNETVLLTRDPHRFLTVMIVEDDEPLREAVRTSFETRGDEVLACASGQEGLQLLHGGAKPDVILLDLMMPAMNGWQFRVEQKQDVHGADIPVIVMSANQSPQAVAMDADAFLRKPVDLRALRETVDRVVGVRERKRQILRAGERERLVSLGAILGGIAHEINNPLALVFGNLDVLQGELLTPPQPGEASVPASAAALLAVRRVRDASERIRAVVRSASAFASADLERVQDIDVQQVLESSIQVAINEIRHTATLTRAYEDVPMVRGNPAQLGQVFLNLILNAIDAIRASGGQAQLLHISTRCEATEVVITVTDHARKLTPEMSVSMFDPLYHDSGDCNLRFGLAVSREFIQSMGGSVEAHPDPVCGASFRVALPIGTPSPHAAPACALPEPRMSREPKALIVDDDPLLCDMLSAMLSDVYDVVAFTSAQAALAALLETNFDVVLCDVMMPHMDGLELFEQVLRQRPEMRDRFVFITGGAFTERARLSLEQTGRPVLNKPTSRQTLLSAMSSIVRAQS